MWSEKTASFIDSHRIEDRQGIVTNSIDSHAYFDKGSTRDCKRTSKRWEGTREGPQRLVGVAN